MISNDMQCSNKLNIPMTYNPQLQFKMYPINNIATNKNKKKFIYRKNIYIYIYIYRQKQSKQPLKQTNIMFVHTPKLK
jgi:hypothetical protein